MNIFVLVGIVSAVLAALWSVISNSIGVITFAGFLGWSTYYAAGGKDKGFKLGILTNLNGVIWGFVTTKICTLLVPYVGQKPAFAITAALGSLIMCSQAKISFLSFIPGSFIGCSAYFATGPSLDSALIGLPIGACIGYISEKAVDALSPKFCKEKSDKVEENININMNSMELSE